VGEEAALAHVELGREPADRQALQSFDGGEVGRRLEDRLAGRVAPAPAAVGLVGGQNGLGAGERFERFGGVHRLQRK
jgi:hypothetical protein